MTAAKDDGKSGERKAKQDKDTWDPAAKPAESASLEEEEDRQFHATHFTADPRGAAMSGAPPAGTRKKRGGTPPDPRDETIPPAPAPPKRRGGTGPE